MIDKDSLLKEKLLKFFTKKKLAIIADIIDRKTKYSLRNIEWFVSNFSKKNNIRYKVNNKMFNVYDSYKNEQLKSYSKKHFDLYRRTNKFLIKITDKRSLETTVAQLNFFKWVMENDILDYVEKHHLDIKKEMVSKNHKKVKHIKGNTISISRNKIIIRFE